MSEQFIIQLLTTLGGLVGSLFAVVKPMLGAAVARLDKRFDTLERQYQELRKDLDGFKMEAIGNYASRQQLEGLEGSNRLAHANMHGRVDTISERLVRVETVQAQCKGCQGKV
jgi:hypothetical protein